jgi:hypothetical protein
VIEGLAIQRNAQLAGVHLVIPAALSWEDLTGVEEAVLNVGGVVLDEVLHPERTIAIIPSSWLTTALTNHQLRRIKSWQSQGLWILTDGWLRDILTFGNRPATNHARHYGVALIDGKISTPLHQDFSPLVMASVPASKAFLDAAIAYQNKHQASLINF